MNLVTWSRPQARRSAFCVLATACLVLLCSSRPARGCICFSEPLCSGRASNDPRTATFIGTVIDIYPAASAIGVHSARRDHGAALALAKVELLRQWRGVLSPEEEQRIRGAASQAQLSGRRFELGPESRRVRFQVAEWFFGRAGATFEIFTDTTSCGYRFETGETYLVVAAQSRDTARWVTEACSRTAPIGSRLAREDVKALRAFRDGLPLPRRIYGELSDWRPPPPAFGPQAPLPKANLRLVGESFNQETRTDAEGWFTFDNLKPAKYQLELLDPAAQGEPAEVDLRREPCAEAHGYVQKSASATKFRIHLQHLLSAPIPAAIPLEEPQLAPPPSPLDQLPRPNLPSFLPPDNGGLLGHDTPATPPDAVGQKQVIRPIRPIAIRDGAALQPYYRAWGQSRI